MYKLLLSLRYFRSRFTALAALLAETFGVAMLFIVLSIMGGYIVQLQENIRGQEGHLQIVSPQPFGVTRLPELEAELARVENVAGAAPFVERAAIYKSGLGFKLCQLKGIDLRLESTVTGFSRYVLRPHEIDKILATYDDPMNASGAAKTPGADLQAATRAVEKLLNAPERQPLSVEEIEGLFAASWRERVLREQNPKVLEILGEPPHAALAGTQLLLERQLSIGQVLTLLTLSPDTSEPVSERFVITGAVQTGEFNLDAGSVYLDVNKAKNMLQLQSHDPEDGGFRYQGIRVALKDPSLLDASRDAVEAAVRTVDPRLDVKTWTELRQTLLKAVMIETILVYILMLILVVFTASMILLMLLLTVIEKVRDIGILMSLGATPQGVAAIFFINGLVIVASGALLGLGLGFLFCSRINEIHDAIHNATGISLFQAKIYQMDRIPVAIDPWGIFWSVGPPAFVGLLASLIPAFWAACRNPIKAIHYE